MAFRIETAARGELTVFTLSGRFEKQTLAELQRLFESQAKRHDIVLDLKDVGVIDRDVMRFFVRCELDGVKFENCPPYIREWMEREIEMNGTYKAVEVATPGVLRLVERPISKPAAGQVRLRVEACGVFHSDLATVQGDYPGLKLPRVPGHEVVGRIDEIGPNVSKWKIGQRVGVGFWGGQDGECEACLRGDFAKCLNPVISGITTDRSE